MTMKKDSSIQIIIDGKDKNHNISYSAFMKVLNSLDTLINKVQKRGGYDVNIQLNDISHSSPINAHLEFKGQDAPLFVGDMSRGFQSLHDIIQNDLKGDQIILPEFVDAAQSISGDISKNKIGDFQLILRADNKDINRLKLKKNHYRVYKSYQDKMNGNNLKAHSKISGRLIAVNLYEGYKFAIHTLLGDKISCIFDEELLEKTKELLGKNVHVMGLSEYKRGATIPHKMIVNNIEEHKEPKERVSFKDLYGLAPGITKGKGAVAFIREIRDAEE